MFTLVAYSQALKTNNKLTYVNPIHDPHLRVEAPNIIVPEGMAHLLGVATFGPSNTRAQLESPSLRRILLLDVMPVYGGTEYLPPNTWLNMFYKPIPLEAFEPMRALIAGAEPDAEQKTVLVWLGDGPQAEITGEIYTVEATCTPEVTAYEWTNAPISLTQVLPAGRYQVVGAAVAGLRLIAARFVFVGGTWRPGCPGVSYAHNACNWLFRRGGLGVWGEFTHDQPPSIDILATGALPGIRVWLDLIKVG